MVVTDNVAALLRVNGDPAVLLVEKEQGKEKLGARFSLNLVGPLPIFRIKNVQVQNRWRVKLVLVHLVISSMSWNAIEG